MLERAALHAREHVGVQHLAHLLDHTLGSRTALRIVEVLTHQDDAATGTAEGLVGRGSDYVGVFYWVFKQTGGNEAGGVGHIDPEDGAHLVGDGAHTGVVPFAGICRSAADDQLWLVLDGELLHLVVVHTASFGIESVGHYII